VGVERKYLEDKTKLTAKEETARSEQTDDRTVKLREFYDTHPTNLTLEVLTKEIFVEMWSGDKMLYLKKRFPDAQVPPTLLEIMNKKPESKHFATLDNELKRVTAKQHKTKYLSGLGSQTIDSSSSADSNDEDNEGSNGNDPTDYRDARQYLLKKLSKKHPPKFDRKTSQSAFWRQFETVAEHNM
jgi:hypothetical protein